MSDISYGLILSLLFSSAAFSFQFIFNKMSLYYFRINMYKDRLLFHFKLSVVSDFYRRVDKNYFSFLASMNFFHEDSSSDILLLYT